MRRTKKMGQHQATDGEKEDLEEEQETRESKDLPNGKREK